MDIPQGLRRLAAQLRHTALRFRVGENWRDQGETWTRAYPDYQAYLAHQRTKRDALRAHSLDKHDARFFEGLRARLDRIPLSVRNRSVLCLGARQGSEVRAFIESGAFAIGVDLNPGQKNLYVVAGDFHDLQFATGSVEIVYTNSLDHAFDLNRVLAEVTRVLTGDGCLIVEAGRGVAKGDLPGFYESFAWADPSVLLRMVLEHGFGLEEQSEFEVPWPGMQYILRRSVAAEV
jgi:SAM-dependent methyltransferase